MSLINQPLIKKLDTSDVYGSVCAFPDQVTDAWSQSEKIELNFEVRSIKEIVVSGMGGSALGGRFISSLYKETLKAPLEIVNNYHLPGYVGGKTLVIADSYSGQTEETLSVYEEAKKRGAKVFVVATGGKLAELARTDKVPHFIFRPIYNPSNEPRMGLGYAIGSIAAILSRLNFIDLTTTELESASSKIKDQSRQWNSEKGGNEATTLAEKLVGKIPILIGSEHLLGAIHTTKNQVNENAKTFSALFPIPELNHHLLEGLSFPASNRQNLFFIFYESSLYHERNQKRYRVSEELLKEKKIEYFIYRPRGKTKMEQALEVVSFGGFVGFYLSLLNNVNPAPIPNVDWFKEQMAK